MITKRHYVSLIVNGTEVELFSQEDLNLRINNKIYDPSKINTSSSEYSFSFDLPKSRVNNKVFDNANIPSKKGKFNKNYPCEVYVDGKLIFSGTLRLKSIDDEQYKCNLVTIKANNIDDIFGDHKMNELRWEVPFVGIDSINVINQTPESDYFYPFVSYGCFQKEPEATYGDINTYTSKYDIDRYTLIYQETFPPSPKITTLVRKLFEQFGYNAEGDIFTDEVANNIYLSNYLANEQDPSYNIGSDLGKCRVEFTARNGTHSLGQGWSYRSPLEGTLSFPYAKNQYTDTYNFDTVGVYDLWSLPQSSSSRMDLGTLTADNKWMFRENCIVIPSDGLYKVSLSATCRIYGESYQVGVYSGRDDELTEITVAPSNIYGEATPFELQIVRNENEVELIHGYDGSNRTVYPHEAGPETTGRRNIRPTTGGGDTETWYIPQQLQMMHYDPYVSPNFICGLSSIGKCYSFMKNYNSWATADGLVTTQFQSIGYDRLQRQSNSNVISTSRSDYHQQNSIGAPINNFAVNTNRQFTGRVSGIIYLKKNDILMAKGVIRKYQDSPNDDGSRVGIPGYWFEVSNGVFEIEALSPNETYASDVPTGAWGLPTQFDTNLNIGEFMNKEENIKDFVNNFVKAFNLTVSQEGNTVFLNKQNLNLTEIKIPVDLDNRVRAEDCESEPIDYPKSMQVSYNIDEEEAGFYNSVPEEHINDNDWKDWADRGSDKVPLNEYDDSAKDETVSLTNSYTWYLPFHLISYSENPGYEDVETNDRTIYLPCISKDEYMIDKYKMEESMQNDGKSLKQRWWFRQPLDIDYWVRDNIYDKQIYLAIPKNTDENGFELSYKNNPNTLLTRYFNVLAMPESNLISVEAYLSPDEYMRLKGGAPIRIDNDIYITCEIKGYDPTGNNTTEIIAMKKC